MATKTAGNSSKASGLQYRPLVLHPTLDSNNNMRLLQLDPGQPGDSLRGRLLHIDIPRKGQASKATPYTALSYVWGYDEPSIPMYMDEGTILLRPNLKNALRRLRLTDRPTNIWTDMICINQDDPDEKMVQIGDMHIIYREAAEVVVWLGIAGSQGADAVDLINRMVDKICQRDLLGSKQTSNRASYHAFVGNQDLLHKCTMQPMTRLRLFVKAAAAFRGSSGKLEAGYRPVQDSERQAERRSYNALESNCELDILPLSSSEDWQTLHWFFQRPWFYRVWIISEVSKNPQIRLVFENTTIEAWKVGMVGAWATRCARRIQTQHAWYDPRGAANAKFIFEKERLPEPGWLVLLHECRSFEASELRDKVFAHLHNPRINADPKYWGQGWAPTYRKDLQTTYTEVAIRRIHASRTLDILSFVDHGHALDPSSISHMQSWVPRWDRQATKRPLIMCHDEGLDAWPRSEFRAPRTNRFTVALPPHLGLRGVYIGAVCRVSLSFSLRHITAAGSYGNDLIPRLWLSYGRAAKPYRPYSKGDKNESIRTAFLLTLTAGAGHSFTRRKSCRLLHADFSAWLLHAFDISPELKQMEPIIKRLRKAAKNGHIGRFEDLLIDTAQGRSFFVTTTGHFGLGPAAMTSGDGVYVCEGSSTTLILRRKSDSHQYLVGDSYTRGLMDGEMLEMLDVRSHVRQIWLQ